MRNAGLISFAVVLSLAGCSAHSVSKKPTPMMWPESEETIQRPKYPEMEIAACTMDAIRQGGRGQMVSKLGPSGWGDDYSHYEAVYTPTTILAQCCSAIRFTQIVKEDQPGWDSPTWEIDWENSGESNPLPSPWYPYQSPFTQGGTGTTGTQASMTDDPGGSSGPGAALGLNILMSFETCAVCVDGTPPDLKERILACNTWSIDFDTKTDERKLNDSTTLFVDDQGDEKDYVRSTTVKSPSADIKRKTGFKDLMDQTM